MIRIQNMTPPQATSTPSPSIFGVSPTIECKTCQASQWEFFLRFRKCPKCFHKQYCSSTCEKRDRKNHKGVCQNYILENDDAAAKEIKDRALDFFYGIPEWQVYRMLLDSFRLSLRYQDRLPIRLRGEQQKNTRKHFAVDRVLIDWDRLFQLVIENKSGVLLPWWSTVKTNELRKSVGNLEERIGERDTEDSDVAFRYGDDKWPAELRLLAKRIF